MPPGHLGRAHSRPGRETGPEPTADGNQPAAVTALPVSSSAQGHSAVKIKQPVTAAATP